MQRRAFRSILLPWERWVPGGSLELDEPLDKNVRILTFLSLDEPLDKNVRILTFLSLDEPLDKNVRILTFLSLDENVRILTFLLDIFARHFCRWTNRWTKMLEF